MPVTTSQGAGDKDDVVRPRRTLAQERSRERQARILAVASGMIAADGSDHLKMSAIAAGAGISIGSLYQYYPDKGAVIRALAERYNAESRRCIVEALADVDDTAALSTAFSGLIDAFYALVRSEPVMRDIWAGMQADKDLAAIQLGESREMAAVLAQAALRANPALDRARLSASTFVIWELGEATIRLAIASDEIVGAQIVEAYKRMALHELSSL